MLHCSNIIHSYIRFIFIWGRRGRDRMIVCGNRMVVGRRGRMVVGFTTTFAISANHNH